MPRAAPEAAKLVREAAAALADDMTSVGFAISHWRDDGIFFEETLAETNRRVPENWNVQTTDGKVLWTETLTTVAFGVATVIVAARTAGHLTGEPSPVLEVRDVSAGRPKQRGPAFYGLAHPNPSFLYRGVNELEVLIQLPSAVGATAPDGRRIGNALMLVEAVEVVSTIAATHGLPLMLVQSPMAAPPADEHPWPPAQTAGVRCAIAMPSDGTKEQLKISQQVHQWAQARGCTLHIGDRRGDGRRGLWHQLSVGNADVYQRKIAPFPRSEETLDLAVPVTFMGPARVGTTAAIMKYLADHSVPVLSVSVMPLENMAFISLLIGLAKAKTDLVSPEAHGSAANILAAVGDLRLAGKATSNEETSNATALAPQDYRACVGRVMEVAPLDHNQRALWASWQFPEQTGAPHTAISQLRTAAKQELGPDAVNMQYVVCRRGDAQDLRGRCKLAVSAEVQPAADAQRRSYARSELCHRIESRWRTLLGRGAPRSIIDVDVTWEESRLGRWLSPPGGARGEADRPMSDSQGLYGRTSAEWMSLVEGCLQFLREQAALGRTTNYTELNQTLQRRHGARPFDFDFDSERAAMGHLLGLAVDEEYEATGLMISSIVLYLNENDAGSGFFAKAVELDLLAPNATPDDRQEFWIEQVRAVQEHYRRRRRRARPDVS